MELQNSCGNIVSGALNIGAVRKILRFRQMTPLISLETVRDKPITIIGNHSCPIERLTGWPDGLGCGVDLPMFLPFDLKRRNSAL